MSSSKPALDAFDRHQFGGNPLVAVDRDQLDRRKPVQAAGEPSELPVMAEGESTKPVGRRSVRIAGGYLSKSENRLADGRHADFGSRASS